MTDSPVIDLVRHGAVDGPLALYGRTDIPMSTVGWDGFASLFAADSCSYTAVVTSPLCRCSAVAERLADRYGVTVHVMPELQEMDFGDWDGVAFSHLKEQWDAMGRFRDAPQDYPPPGGETLSDFCRRVLSGWTAVKAAAEEHGATLVLCHGGPIRIIVADILGLELVDGRLFRRLTVPHASRTRIRLTAAEAVVEHVAHLL